MLVHDSDLSIKDIISGIHQPQGERVQVGSRPIEQSPRKSLKLL